MVNRPAYTMYQNGETIIWKVKDNKGIYPASVDQQTT